MITKIRHTLSLFFKTNVSTMDKLRSSPNPKPLLLSKDDPLEVLHLPIRMENALKHGNVKTIGQFCRRKRKRLYKIKNLGLRSVSYLMKIKRNIKLTPAPFASNAVSIDWESKKPDISNAKTSSKEPLSDGQQTGIPQRFYRSDPVEVLGLPLRLENALKLGKIRKLGELYDYLPKRLYLLRNIGTKSVHLLMQTKKEVVFVPGSKDLPVNGRDSARILSLESTREGVKIPREVLIKNLLDRCGNDRSKDVIERRYGLINGEKETLEEIGNSYGVTRERIRQIQMRAIRKMKHPSTRSRKPIISLSEELLFENDGIISDEEADGLVGKIFKNLPFDGSSLLDLLADLGWIQKHAVGDLNFYAPRRGTVKLSEVMEGIVEILRKNETLLSAQEILKNFLGVNNLKAVGFKPLNFIKRCCRLDPRIEEKIENKFGLYSMGYRAVHLWVPLMSRVLEKEQMPMHFTEIADKVNDLLISSRRRLEPRRAHSVLIENPEFAHTGIRGMYGLTRWGLRKEPTIEIVRESIEKAGFPLHFDQIYNYVSKYKDSPEVNIKSILALSEKFINKGKGFYELKK